MEAASPRGRIALMKAAYDGMMEADQAFQQQMDLCLGCRACEPACPSDVKYGQLIEQAREAVAAERKHSLPVRAVRKLFLEKLFPYQGRMRLLGQGLRFYQKSGLRTLVRASGVMHALPSHMREMEHILPDAAGDGVLKRWERLGFPSSRERLSSGREQLVIPPVGEKAGRAALFRGCIMDVLFTDTNINTIRLLREAGFEVVIPDGQGCCGALHAHTGETGQAKQLAKANVEVFRETGCDWIATNAGGCGAMLKEYDHLLHDDAETSEAARQFAGAIKDISELIDGKLARKIPMKANTAQEAGQTIVTYQDSCHLRNVMRVQTEPRTLLRSIPGVELRELQGADRCCGSAGIYNITQTGMSQDIIDHKMEHVAHTNAHLVVTSNPGCLLQMQWGIVREGHMADMKAVHLVDLLAARAELSTNL